VRCRPVRARDAERLALLDARCFSADTAYSRDVMDAILRHPGSLGFAIEDSTGIRAFVLGASSGKTGEIITIDVSPGHRRRGLGTRLMAALQNRLRSRGVEDLYLQCSVENRRALCFYWKQGFRVVQRLPDYYKPGSDAFLLLKSPL